MNRIWSSFGRALLGICALFALPVLAKFMPMGLVPGLLLFPFLWGNWRIVHDSDPTSTEEVERGIAEIEDYLAEKESE